MKSIYRAFGCPVGLSDHSLSIALPIAAAALGARVIEKHFTLDMRATGPDHASSATPKMLEAIVSGIRDVELCLGDGIKIPAPSEQENQLVIRKCLVAAKPIKIGENFCLTNITSKRPMRGLSPMYIWDLIGRTAAHDYEIDEVIKLDEL